MSRNGWMRIAAALAAVALAQIPAGAQETNPAAPAETLKKLTEDLPQLLKAADADGNGTLNASEFRPFARSLKKTAEEILNKLDPSIAQKKAAKELKKYDANADGRVDDDERKAIAEEARKKEIKDFDWDKNGELSEREKTAMQWAEEGKLDYRFAQTDVNKDKEVSAEELAAALSSLTGIKVKKV